MVDPLLKATWDSARKELTGWTERASPFSRPIDLAAQYTPVGEDRARSRVVEGKIFNRRSRRQNIYFRFNIKFWLFLVIFLLSICIFWNRVYMSAEKLNYRKIWIFLGKIEFHQISIRSQFFLGKFEFSGLLIGKIEFYSHNLFKFSIYPH